MGDVLEILPFEDPIVVLAVDGETIWSAMEASLSTWPGQEGYVFFFPSVLHAIKADARFPQTKDASR